MSVSSFSSVTILKNISEHQGIYLYFNENIFPSTFHENEKGNYKKNILRDDRILNPHIVMLCLKERKNRGS